VVYPWLADVAYLTPSGTLASAVVDGSMTLSLSDNMTLCLLAVPTDANASAFGPHTLVGLELLGVGGAGAQSPVQPCPLVPEWAAKDRVCCRPPALTTLCAAAGGPSTAACEARGVYARVTVAAGPWGAPGARRRLQMVTDVPAPEDVADIPGVLTCPNTCPGVCVLPPPPPTHTHEREGLVFWSVGGVVTASGEGGGGERNGMAGRGASMRDASVVLWLCQAGWRGFELVAVAAMPIPAPFRVFDTPRVDIVVPPCCSFACPLAAPSRGVLFTAVCGPHPEACMGGDPSLLSQCHLGTPPHCAPCPEGAFCTCGTGVEYPHTHTATTTAAPPTHPSCTCVQCARV
jgi:hypothetical protein